MVEDIDGRFLYQGKVQFSLAEPFPSQDSLVFCQGRSQTAVLVEQTEPDTPGLVLRQQPGVIQTEREVPGGESEISDQVLAPLQ